MLQMEPQAALALSCLSAVRELGWTALRSSVPARVCAGALLLAGQDNDTARVRYRRSNGCRGLGKFLLSRQGCLREGRGWRRLLRGGGNAVGWRW
jgi:hypothetical protein